MTAPAPAIRLTGIRKSIPPGYTLGRITAGIGDVQLVRHDELAVKLAQTGQVLSPTTQQWQAGNVSALDSTELVINSTTITLANRGAGTLMGNPGTAAAKPSDITIGTGLTLSAAGTLSNSGIISLVGGSGITISNGNTVVNAGIVSLVGGTNVTITNGNTISATGGGGSGTVTQIVAGTGLSGGTITTSGTVALGTIAASSLMGNAGTAAAVPGAITVGSNLTLSAAGTLSATGGGGSGTVTNVATGAGLSGGPITTTGTIVAQWQGGTVTALNGLAITSGTIAPVVDGTSVTLSGGTLSATGGGSSYHFAPAMPVVLGTQAVNSTGAATSGNMVTFAATSTISAIGWLLDSLTNAGSYVASITPVNASGVATSGPTNSATLIASGTSGGWFNFAFSPAVTVAAGSTYALSLSVLNEGTAFVEPVRWTGIAGRGSWRNTNAGGTSSVNNGIFQNPVTAITNGLTLAGKNTGFYYMTMDILP